ncbi:MAG: pyridoxal-phosphate dependent enzyme [Ferruginibacter sp.]
MLFPTSNLPIQKLSDVLFDDKEVTLSVLRLDTIHPVVSGNKLFKLHYFLQHALRYSSKGIITFGGAYSNHLVAVAYACKEIGLKSIAFVRGEAPNVLSHTLQSCKAYGMDLQFISRQEYDQKDEADLVKEMQMKYPGYLLIPEGGYSRLGAEGARLIMDLIPDNVSHICCAIGTATTLSGLLVGLKENQQVIGVPILKNLQDLTARINYLTNQLFTQKQLLVLTEYHFGGYAKRTPALIDFMNALYEKHTLPTDFVYTGKMMFGIIDSIEKGLFPKGSSIVCLHTGGLQGNLTLKSGVLVF